MCVQTRNRKGGASNETLMMHTMTPATTQAASGPRRRPSPPLPTIPESCAAASPDEPPSPAEVNRQILGERLHALIQVEQGSLAGKITGMLLESLDNSELAALIDDREALQSWIQALVGAASRLRQEEWVRERERDMGMDGLDLCSLPAPHQPALSSIALTPL